MEKSNEKNNKIKISLNKAIVIILAVIILVTITIIGVKKYNTSKVPNENTFNEDNSEVYDENCNVNIFNVGEDWLDMGVGREDKPVIYLYPEEKMKVNVKLGRSDKLTCSYPKYEEKGWNIIAEPSGRLTDIDTGRELYCLYWEGKNTNNTNINEGFVVKGEDTIRFLEEKLEILGLNEKEAQEFIIYWLPQMEDNEYNYIRFETIEEINENMPLEITPTPDNIIRINMVWKALDKHIEVKEQLLEKTPRRTGFTVVEWGGTKLN